MKIRVKLFATLRENREKDMVLDLDKDMTPLDIIKQLNIPEEDVSIIMINGRRKEQHTPLETGDTLALFPPVGGG